MMEHKSNSSTGESSKFKSENSLQQHAWQDLPHDILQKIIFGHLDIIGHLSFRGTCKEWRRFSSSKASTTSTKFTKKVEEPWFLIYGSSTGDEQSDRNRCLLYDTCSEKMYNFNFPELKDVDCIASKGGWLLLYRNSDRSMFFFCPFSRAKVDLPKLPIIVNEGECLLIGGYNQIAAFSSSPISPDCIVCVATQIRYGTKIKIVLNVLGRRGSDWDKHEYCINLPGISNMYIVTCATLHNGVIYLLDSYGAALSFSLEMKTWRDRYKTSCNRLPLWSLKEYFKNKLDRTTLGLNRITDSLSICGTELIHGGSNDEGHRLNTCIHNESIISDGRCHPFNSMSENHYYKGVWIHPRFLELPSHNFTW